MECFCEIVSESINSGGRIVFPFLENIVDSEQLNNRNEVGTVHTPFHGARQLDHNDSRACNQNSFDSL